MVIFLMGTVFMLSAQVENPSGINDESETNATTDEDSSEKDGFQFTGDRTAVNLSEGREYTVLSGNAVVESGTILLRAQEIELYGDDFQYVTCKGDVHFVDTSNGLDLQAQELFFDRQSEDARAAGRVVLDDAKNNLIAHASSIEIFDNSNKILFKIGVRIVQDDLFVRSELIVYNRNTEELRLEGFPSVIWGEDRYQALAMNINLNTEEVELVGQVRGSIVTDGNASPPQDAPAPSNTNLSSSDNEENDN